MRLPESLPRMSGLGTIRKPPEHIVLASAKTVRFGSYLDSASNMASPKTVLFIPVNGR
jgi:hypothetical protein